ncbi:hypothetical protein [Streptomyces sp. PR69]|uniref:hypothetical protein n=1 Tax=Streptomyces sp. PR69 TaxID=2984950 RepID=UPI00226456EB|nr:hypothetical protein [Streptomyces sp. PR69]
MTPHQLTQWAATHPWPTLAVATPAALLAAAVAWRTIRALRSMRRPPASVVTAAVGALVCTAYTADTSWRFAEHRLGMHDTAERIVMFAAAEIALLACAVMARANKRATATDTAAGSPGVPGVLVWVITGVQVIPAYSESGIVGGTVRAVIGPVMAGLLWHLAMGLEIRVARPEALSTGLPAVIGRELRERLLSYLGLATRDRTAEQITRDRAMTRAVRLAARPRLRGWGRRRLAAAVARAHVGTDGEQRHRLLQELAARRTSYELATVPLPSPWAGTAVPAPSYPSTPLGVTGAQLRRLEPVDAITQVRSAHPTATPAEVAALCTEYGVPVSETLVRVATRAGNPPRPKKGPERPVLAVVPDSGLLLDVQTADEVHPEVRAHMPVPGTARARTPRVHARVPAGRREPDHGRSVPSAAGTEDLLARARVLDAQHRQEHGRPASIHALKRGLRIGQPKAEQVRDLLREVQG